MFGQEDLQLLGGSDGRVASHGEGPGDGIDEDAQRGLNIGGLQGKRVSYIERSSSWVSLRECGLTWREYFSTEVMAAS